MRQFIFSMKNFLNLNQNFSRTLNYVNGKAPNEFSFMKILNFIRTDSINFVWLGTIDYSIAWDYQKKIHKLIQDNKINDTILFLEHPHVYTFGKNADKNNLLPSYNKLADVIQSDRGGEITYHGPGQLVVYPIINLSRYKKSITWYINTIESVIIDTLRKYKINASRKPGLTGVWVEEEKIAAIGVRLSKWITMHGFALNVRPDMQFYKGMIPCGIFEYGITSIFELINKKIDSNDIIKDLIRQFSNNLRDLNEV